MTQYMTEAEAAQFLSLSKRTLQAWRMKQMGPPFHKLENRLIRYKAEDLQQWLDDSSQGGKP